VSFDTWANDRVWSVTARLYCSCGEALHTTAAWLTVMETIAEFWGKHEGFGHGPCTPQIARQARKRRGRVAK